MKIDLILRELSRIAPLEIAEGWDNVGLLLGDPQGTAHRIMTCLTVSESTVQEAIDRKTDLILSHHPIPFRPLQRIVTSDPTGRLLWNLARHGISVYSPHTAWDNASAGINAQLATFLQLEQVEALVPKTHQGQKPFLPYGTGRCGFLSPASQPTEILSKLQNHLPTIHSEIVGRKDRLISRIAIVCGSGGSLLSECRAANCDAFLTGEATYHQMLEAEHRDITLILIGHYASERFAMESLAGVLKNLFPTLEIWASKQERDPLKTH